MRKLLLSLSARLQLIIIIGSVVILSFFTAIICTHFFDTHELVTNTELISSIYQVMGTIYAILLTFTLWGVWQNYTNADASVQKETYALLDLVHTIELSASWHLLNVRDLVLTYLNLVINQEWPNLKNLTNSSINIQESTHSKVMEILNLVQNIMPNNERESVIFHHALMLFSEWLDARRTRLLMARGNSAKALWPLLLTGAFILFLFHGLLVAKTIGIWAILLFGISFVIGVTFYLIFSLDCPFTGSPSVDSEPFLLAINILSRKEPPK